MSTNATKAIWVVDDTAVVADSLAALLRANGYETMALYGGEFAMERLTAGEEPRLMIVDMNMPCCDGNTLINAIVANAQWTFPIIVLSGYESDLARELRGRVFKAMGKTIDPDELLMAAKKALGEETLGLKRMTTQDISKLK